MKLSIATSIVLASMTSSASAFAPSIPSSSSLGVRSHSAEQESSALKGAIRNRAIDWVESGIEKRSLRATTRLVDKMDIEESSKDILKQLDAFTMVGSSVPKVLIDGTEPETNDELVSDKFDLGWKKTDDAGDWEKDPVEVTTQDISKDLKIQMHREDDFFGQVGSVFDFGTRFVRKAISFPLDDKVAFFNSEKDAITCSEDLRLAPGMACPDTYNTWGDMASDESFSRYFFNGFGVVGLAAQKETSKSDLGPFEVDMPIQDFEVRPGFRPYGARVHFDADQNPTGIFDYAKDTLVKPGDDDWESAKWLAKSTAFTLNTVKEHLMWGHLIVSNSLTFTCTNNLPPDHPIRRLLTIFTFRTNTINDQAFAALVPEVSTLHRATSLTYPALQKMFEVSYNTCDAFEPFCDKKIIPELQALSDEGKFPYYSEGNAFFELVRTFVKNWIAEAGGAAAWDDDATRAFYAQLQDMNKGQAYDLPDFSEEALVHTISQSIFYVTAMHEIIGTIIDYARVPNGAGTRVVEGAIEADAQAFLDNLVIVSVTGLKMPKLMKSYDNFFGEGGAPAWEKDVWAMFVKDLEEQSKAVREADANREVEFKFFDPALFECSISV